MNGLKNSFSVLANSYETLGTFPALDLVLEVLAEVFDVEVDTIGQRRRGSPLWGVAARRLWWYLAWTQRDVTEELGMGGCRFLGLNRGGGR